MASERAESPPIGGGSSAFRELSGSPEQAAASGTGDSAQAHSSVSSGDRPRDQGSSSSLSSRFRGSHRRVGGVVGVLVGLFRGISRGAQLVVILLIRTYQVLASPLPSPCGYYPTCSTYALEAVKKYGVLKGCWLGLRRILRCHPFRPGGFDPVP